METDKTLSFTSQTRVCNLQNKSETLTSLSATPESGLPSAVGPAVSSAGGRSCESWRGSCNKVLHVITPPKTSQDTLPKTARKFPPKYTSRTIYLLLTYNNQNDARLKINNEHIHNPKNKAYANMTDTFSSINSNSISFHVVDQALQDSKLESAWCHDLHLLSLTFSG